GLSFSVLPPTKLFGSLKNIYKQLASDIPAFSPSKIGSVPFRLPILLSSFLASSGSIPASLSSHAKKGWESFTDAAFTDAVLNAVLDRANDTGRGVVFFA
ncbi:hypothetical protein EV363DRAFT_1125567, partial [Boletus edulis]